MAPPSARPARHHAPARHQEALSHKPQQAAPEPGGARLHLPLPHRHSCHHLEPLSRPLGAPASACSGALPLSMQQASACGQSGWQLPHERAQGRPKRTRAASKAACRGNGEGEEGVSEEEQRAALDECMARRLQEQEDAALAQHHQHALSLCVPRALCCRQILHVPYIGGATGGRGGLGFPLAGLRNALVVLLLSHSCCLCRCLTQTTTPAGDDLDSMALLSCRGSKPWLMHGDKVDFIWAENLCLYLRLGVVYCKGAQEMMKICRLRMTYSYAFHFQREIQKRRTLW